MNIRRYIFLAVSLLMLACAPEENPVEPGGTNTETPDEKPDENPDENPDDQPAGLKAMLDVVFNADGTAADASGNDMNIYTAPAMSLVTYYSEYSKSYVARFNNQIGQSTTFGFYKVHYKSETEFKEALKDGHSLEVMFMVDDELPASKEVKMFSSHESGGTGFLITNGSKNQEITFLPHVGGGYRWAQSGITPERGRYYHVVGVWDKEAGKARVYVDGQLKNEVAAAGELKMVADKYQWFGVGADSGNQGDCAWKGDVVIARVYDEALTGEQVAELKAKADYGFPVSDVFLDDVLYLSGFAVAEGCNYRILGKGFKDGDRIIWESADNPSLSYSGSGKVSEDCIEVAVPAGLASGTYKIMLDRNGVVNPLGIVEMKISDAVVEYRIPKIIAHRCYHNAGAPENSLEAFTAAQKLGGVYGAEIDIYITADDVIVLNHDPKFKNISIEKSNYDDFKDHKLANGEPLPLLTDILKQAQKDPSMKIIIEFKDHEQDARDHECVDRTMAFVEEYGLKDQVEYITFVYDICKRVVSNDPEAIVAFLGGSKTPSEVHADGIKSIDYQLSVLTSHKDWVKAAQDLGMIVNTWTCNTDTDLFTALSYGVDYITTDCPERLKEINDLLK